MTPTLGPLPHSPKQPQRIVCTGALEDSERVLRRYERFLPNLVCRHDGPVQTLREVCEGQVVQVRGKTNEALGILMGVV